jgi:hypothetical protein
MRIKVKTGSGMDANGYPVEPSGDWLAPVSCLVTSAHINYLAQSQNENVYVDASYTVLIESDSENIASLKAGERVKIERFGCDLGEFSVIKVEPLHVIGIIKITV